MREAIPISDEWIANYEFSENGWICINLLVIIMMIRTEQFTNFILTNSWVDNHALIVC